MPENSFVLFVFYLMITDVRPICIVVVCHCAVLLLQKTSVKISGARFVKNLGLNLSTSCSKSVKNCGLNLSKMCSKIYPPSSL